MKQKKITIVCILLFFLMLAADQFTKYLAVTHLKDFDPIALIPGVFELYYLENRGAAWGMMTDMRWLFLVLSLVMLLVVGYLWIKMPKTRQYHAARILLTLVAAGTVGNAIDRLIHSYVVDFLYISLIDFPVFNVADCLITLPLMVLIILYRNEDFAWMKKS